MFLCKYKVSSRQVWDIEKQVFGAASADHLVAASDDSCQVQLTVTQLPFAGECLEWQSAPAIHFHWICWIYNNNRKRESDSCKKPDSVSFVVDSRERVRRSSRKGVDDDRWLPRAPLTHQTCEGIAMDRPTIVNARLCTFKERTNSAPNASLELKRPLVGESAIDAPVCTHSFHLYSFVRRTDHSRRTLCCECRFQVVLSLAH